jgi:hypothetical protein
MTALRRKAGLRGDERGLAATEFAIIIGPLFMALMGLLDMGFNMYAKSLMQGALNDVARQATVEVPAISGTGTVEQRLNAAIQGRMGKLVKRGTYTIGKKSYYDFTSIGKPEKIVTDVNGNGRIDTGDCWQDNNRNGTWDSDSGKDGMGGADDVVVYTVTLDMPRLLPLGRLIGLPNTQRVMVKTTVRNQPYANQASPPVDCKE